MCQDGCRMDRVVQDFLGKKFPSRASKSFSHVLRNRGGGGHLPPQPPGDSWVLESELRAGPAPGQGNKHSPRPATSVPSQLLGLQPSTPTLSVSDCKEIILLHSQSKLFLGKSRILGGNHIIREGRASSFVLFFRAAFGANNLSFLE